MAHWHLSLCHHILKPALIGLLFEARTLDVLQGFALESLQGICLIRCLQSYCLFISIIQYTPSHLPHLLTVLSMTGYVRLLSTLLEKV